MRDPYLVVSTELFSTELGLNNDAVAVIKQQGTIVKSAQREYLDNEVVESPSVGFSRLVTFSFDMRRFKVNAPFTVTVSNVMLGAESGEFQCKFDGREFPETGTAAAPSRSCAQPNVPARTIRAVEPDTPPLAQQQGISGDVAVIVSLNAQSQVVNVKVQSSPSELLNNTALQAAHQSTFQTETVNCKPVPSEYLYTVQFSSK
jgi:TonB family protein